MDALYQPSEPNEFVGQFTSTNIQGTLMTSNRIWQLALIVASLGGAASTESIASIIQYSGNGNYYEFVSAPQITWSDARDAAALRVFDPGSGTINGYLATLTDTGEDAFVQVNYSSNFGAWLGGSDSATEGDWRWVTGPEGAANAGLGTVFGFTNWKTGEPNDSFSFGGEDYLAINWPPAADVGEFGWNDAPNDGGLSVTGNVFSSGYVVEYSTAAVPEPTTLIVWSLLGIVTTVWWRRKRQV